MPGQFRFDAATAVLATLIAALLPSLNRVVAAEPPTTFVAEEAADGDLFGSAVDVRGALIAIGAYSTDLSRDDVGVVYLFSASAEGIEQQARLTAGDGELADKFGAAVAIGDDVVLVGAPGVIQAELNEGAAYLYEKQGDAWTEVTKLRRETTSKNDMFGTAVGLDGAVAVVGAPGADVAGTDSGTALVYERLAGDWVRVAALVPQDAAAGERFGSAVAVDGDRILIGASGSLVVGDYLGSAYVFERAGDGWRQAAQLTPSDGMSGDAFGESVALADDLALVGARFADLTGSDEGAAYVFESTSDGWVQLAKLTAPEPADRDQFGHSVALAGQVAFVGAPRVDEPDRDAGGVWAFSYENGMWVTKGRRSPSAPETYDEFGRAVAAEGPLLVVGAPQDIPEGGTEETVTGTVTLFRQVR